MPYSPPKTPEAKQRSMAGLTPFKSGAEWNGNHRGGKIGASVREWWNNLCRENEDGVAKYSMQDIKKIIDAPADDKKVSPAKRIAARHILEMTKGGRTGREVSALVYDRTEGKAPQSVNLTGGPEIKTIVLMDQAQPALPEGDG